VNPRIQELLDEVMTRSQQHIGAMFGAIKVHEIFGDKLVEIADPVEVGEHGHVYEVRLLPALTHQEPIAGKARVEFTFVVFSPTGELRSRRDRAEPGEPNSAFVEMATDFAPGMPWTNDMMATITAVLEDTWPAIKFAHLVTTTSQELDLVGVFVDIESMKRLAIDVARG
jgi:hypothetical protein